MFKFKMYVGIFFWFFLSATGWSLNSTGLCCLTGWHIYPVLTWTGEHFLKDKGFCCSMLSPHTAHFTVQSCGIQRSVLLSYSYFCDCADLQPILSSRDLIAIQYSLLNITSHHSPPQTQPRRLYLEFSLIYGRYDVKAPPDVALSAGTQSCIQLFFSFLVYFRSQMIWR